MTTFGLYNSGSKKNCGNGNRRPGQQQKILKCQRGFTSYPLSEGQRQTSHLMVQHESLKSTTNWRISVEGFWNHVATDGSVGKRGKWSACGWSVVAARSRRDGSMHGVYGTMDAELEVQRTIKRADGILVFRQESDG